ncbi:hypothetical protein GCM10023196_024250 [Actinoallomurus vinaceus]|uniref:Uncharacterized protein n=1 Tax=Actinoallomurus vinaceus TaxID=1080074 RepID=A0ABP8U5G4_9ACTN
MTGEGSAWAAGAVRASAMGAAVAVARRRRVIDFIEIGLQAREESDSAEQGKDRKSTSADFRHSPHIVSDYV